MSLLSSIFGGGSSEPKPGQDGLSMFQTTVELPAPKPAPPASLKRNKVAVDRGEEPFDGESGKKKKKRKLKKDDSAVEKSTDALENSDDVDSDKAVERRTVFVGNLPVSYTRKQLAQLFADCGKISSTRIRSVAVTGVKLPPDQAGNQKMVKKVCANTRLVDDTAKSCVVGYVVFAYEEDGDGGSAAAKSVAKALQLNNSEVEKGRRVRVDHANAEYDAQRSVFVGNLPYGAEESSLQEHICRVCGLAINDVEGVRIVRDKDTFRCKGFGYILFRDRSMVAIALQRLSSKGGNKKYENRELRVQVCGKRFKNKRGVNDGVAAVKKRLLSSSLDGTSNASRQTADGASKTTSSGFALRKVLEKSIKAAPEKKRRARGEKSKNKVSAKRMPGVSKRAALDAKVDKRVKKLEKRAAKGMGKAKK